MVKLVPVLVKHTRALLTIARILVDRSDNRVRSYGEVHCYHHRHALKRDHLALILPQYGVSIDSLDEGIWLIPIDICGPSKLQREHLHAKLKDYPRQS